MPYKLSPLPAFVAVLSLTACSLLAGCSAAGSSTGSAPVSGTPVPTPTAGVSIAPSPLAFPATAANVTSAPLTLTVTNTGGAALTVTGAAISGTNAANFAETSNCSTVAAGASCTLQVTFTPAAASTTYNAVVVLTDNAGGVAGSTQTVAISGTSAAPVPVPQAVLAPAALSFTAPLLTAAGRRT